MSADASKRHAERLLAAHALPAADPAMLVRLLGRCPDRRLAIGDVLCRQGEAGEEIFFLLEGRLRVLKKDQEGREREIGMWFAPALAGTLALAEGARRSATCVAAAPSMVAVADGALVRALLHEASAEASLFRWMLLCSMTETLASVRQAVRALIGAPTPAPQNLDQLHALVERAGPSEK